MDNKAEIVDSLRTAEYHLTMAKSMVPANSNLSDDLLRALEDVESIKLAVYENEYDAVGMAK